MLAERASIFFSDLYTTYRIQKIQQSVSGSVGICSKVVDRILARVL
eukprot:COSAG05_NODE_20538_length_278_cov_1.150838_1_plen_45_part_01